MATIGGMTEVSGSGAAPDSNALRVQAWSDHLSRQGISVGAGPLAVPFRAFDFAVGCRLLSHLLDLVGLTIIVVAVITGYVRRLPQVLAVDDASGQLRAAA
jgi:hypothetical protein